MTCPSNGLQREILIADAGPGEKRKQSSQSSRGDDEEEGKKNRWGGGEGCGDGLEVWGGGGGARRL